jgi:hypothetical protein
MKLEFQSLTVRTRRTYGFGAIQAEHTFANGYGVSVVKHKFSYGNEDGLYELAVLHRGQLCYTTPITSDVVGGLTLQEAEELADEVAALPTPSFGNSCYKD